MAKRKEDDVIDSVTNVEETHELFGDYHVSHEETNGQEGQDEVNDFQEGGFFSSELQTLII